MSDITPISPQVAVILVTCHSPGPMLHAALESLQHQTYRDWTLTIVDDGSPEPSGIEEAARAFSGARLLHQARRGVAIARNVGLTRSTSRYVAYLDDDDIWYPEKLQRQVALLNSRPDAVACHCQYDVVSTEGSLVGRGTADAYNMATLLRGRAHSLFPTMLIRRSAIEDCGTFSTNFPAGEDVDMTYRLARQGEILFIEDSLYAYRRHAGNATNNLRSSSIASVSALKLQLARHQVEKDHAGVADARAGLRAARRYWARADIDEAAAIWRRGDRFSALALGAWSLRFGNQEAIRFLVERLGRKVANSFRQRSPTTRLFRR